MYLKSMCSGNKDATQTLVNYGLQDLTCKERNSLKEQASTTMKKSSIYKSEVWLCNMIMSRKSNLMKRKIESPRQKT